MKISIISFSGRANGNCSQIADYLNELHQGEATIYRFSDFSISACGNCNHECMAGNSCPHIDDMEVTLQEATANSDMTYFIVPNYCGYPCSNFFVFNERCVCWTWGRQDRVDAYNNAQKKAIIVSNSGADNFKKLLGYHGMKEDDMLFLGSRTYGSPLMASEEAKAVIRAFIER